MFGLSKAFDFVVKLESGIRLARIVVRKWFNRQIDKRIKRVDKRVEKTKTCLKKFYRMFTKFREEEFDPLKIQSEKHQKAIYLLLKEVQKLKTRVNAKDSELEVLTKRTSSNSKDNLSITHKVSKSRAGLNLTESKSTLSIEDVLAIFPKDLASSLAELMEKENGKKMAERLVIIYIRMIFEQNKIPQPTQSDDELSTLDKIKSRIALI